MSGTVDTITGADLLARTLHLAGVRTIFSLSGNQIMPVYDACLTCGIRIVHVRHEAAAVYMADALAQLTGQVGVALVTAGAGFANGLAPLVCASAAESPVLLLSGDAPCGQDGMGAFQEMDQVAIATPMVKYSARLTARAEIAKQVTQALRIARAGRPGPVHLSLPFDVLTERDAPIEHDPGSFTPEARTLDTASAQAVSAMLAGAEAPLILTGPALSRTRAGPAVARLEAAVQAPVIALESPRGLRDPSLGLLPEVMAKADVILLLGKQPDFTIDFLGDGIGRTDARFTIIDPEPEILERAAARLGSRLAITAHADSGAAAEGLSAAARPARTGRQEWARSVREALSFRDHAAAGSGAAMHPETLCRALAERVAKMPEAILVIDGGEFGQWAQAFCDAPRRIINGVSGAIGGGLCYAIAAKIAFPDAPVYAVMGDGTLGFHLAEFETALREEAHFVAVIGNDDRWNAEYQIQLRSFGANRTHGCELTPAVRYDQAVAALGGHGAFVTGTDANDADAALAAAEAVQQPACVNVRIDGLPAPAFSRAATATKETA